MSVNSIIQATEFLLWHQVKYILTEYVCQDFPENWFGRQKSLGSRKDNPSIADFEYKCSNIAILETKEFSSEFLMVMLLIVRWLS